VPPAVALTLTVDRQRWRAHLARTVAAFPGLVPVVKGNGYGFGRTYLAELVAVWARTTTALDELAVGTVHELAGLPADGPRPLVLTPALTRELAPSVGPAVLTVGSARQVAQVAGSGLHPPVVVKLATTMARYGVTRDELPAVLAAVEAAGLAVHGFSIHPPLAGSATAHAAEADLWAEVLPDGATVYVSHLDAPAYAALAAAHPELHWRIRLGTALWHGDKSCFHLTADVVQVRPVSAGSLAGYRLLPVPGDGSLVMVTAGTAHGVRPLPGGSSPFHFARRRLALLEPPHMHTSMVFVPAGDLTPEVGDQVDVQHPLTMTLVDRIVER
jgi:alanine racemase